MESIIRVDKEKHKYNIDKIIKKAVGGDRQAFATAINENIEYLYKIAYMHLKDEQKSLDAIQECTYKAFINIKKLKNPKIFRTWITRILINTCVDEIRKHNNIIELDNETPFISGCEDISIDEKLDLYDAIDSLKSEYRTVIILKYFDDLSVEEISKATETPISTVKTRLSRARKALGVLLKEEN